MAAISPSHHRCRIEKIQYEPSLAITTHHYYDDWRVLAN